MLKAGAKRAAGAYVAADGVAVVAAHFVTDGETIFEIGEVAVQPIAGAGSEALETALAEALSPLAPEIAGIGGPEMAAPWAGSLEFSGPVLAEVLGCTVASDFAAADLRLGGSGGPMGASLAHAIARMEPGGGPLLLLEIDSTATRAIYADPSIKAEREGALLAFVAGPGLPVFGETPEGGGADDAALDLLLSDPYFLRLAPKSIGPGAFSAYFDHLQSLPPQDAEATSLAAIALSLVTGLDLLPKAPRRAIVFGPARHAPRLIAALTEGLECQVITAEEEGLPGDAFYPLAAAHMAVRAARGLPTSFPGTSGVKTAVGGASLSRPGALG